MIALVNKNLVGRCGLYCGSCMIFRAYKDSEELRNRVAEEKNCGPEEIRCEGCQTVLIDGWDLKGEQWGRNCRIIRCLETKGVAFCYECDTYPDCKKFHVIADYCLKRSEDVMENLRRIKAGEVDEWLEAEDRKWRCKKCGKPVAIQLRQCHWCGERIN